MHVWLHMSILFIISLLSAVVNISLFSKIFNLLIQSVAIHHIINMYILPEPYCVGEYIIDISPSQSVSNDNECKRREIVSAVVDKVISYVYAMCLIHFGHC